MFRFPLVGGVLVFFVLSCAPGQSQQRGLPQAAPSIDEGPETKQMKKAMERQRQKQRYEEMKRDSARLLELATELKQHVDQAGENVLSVDVIKRAEEMEKLARRVKENMRGE
jgi:hypothetical protein